MSTVAPPPLTALEIACGIVLPAPRRPPRLPVPPRGTTPRIALEQAIRPALRRSPCLVSFSGGRDSSAVLAVAAAVARREGMPLPVPITHRFAAAAGTQESEWQEQVVRHLQLDDWIRVQAGDDLDCIGPVATAVMRRHGLLWPCNAYLHAPLLAEAAGGALLTGIGGDEAFSPSTWSRALAVLGRRARPVPRDVLRIGFAAAPAAVKRPLIRRRLPDICHWLRPAARREVEARIAADAAVEPLRWRSRYRAVSGSAVMAAGLASLAAIGADDGAALVHPFRDRLFLSTLAHLPPARRHRSRTEAMRALAGDLLPHELLSRPTKAHFGDALLSGRSRELAASWEGDGVDPAIVDVERLMAEWRSPEPDTHTITLLQSVWLTRARAAARRPEASLSSPAGG